MFKWFQRRASAEVFDAFIDFTVEGEWSADDCIDEMVPTVSAWVDEIDASDHKEFKFIEDRLQDRLIKFAITVPREEAMAECLRLHRKARTQNQHSKSQTSIHAIKFLAGMLRCIAALPKHIQERDFQQSSNKAIKLFNEYTVATSSIIATYMFFKSNN